MNKHKKPLIIIGAVLIILVSILAVFLRFDVFLPHNKIQIILPFAAQYDVETKLIPMGETIYHPKPKDPNGHPGIDFVSQKPFPFIASADGTISKMVKGGSSDGTDIYISSGPYSIVYKEMDSNNMFVKLGQQVKQGDKIAMPDPKYDTNATSGKSDSVHYSTHWEFASASPIQDRFCPLTYFTPDSLKRIDVIWSNVGQSDFNNMKQQFPNICNGDYSNRVD